MVLCIGVQESLPVHLIPSLFLGLCDSGQKNIFSLSDIILSDAVLIFFFFCVCVWDDAVL